MKTELADCTLTDILVVAKGLPADEVKQIEAFTGNKYNYEEAALSAYQNSMLQWVIRLKDSKEPMAVGGLIRTGPVTCRTWFFATERAWAEVGRELTVHTARTRKKLLEQPEHARIETLCLASRKQAREWYKTVGLTYESTLRGYGVNGESAVMYVTVKGAQD